jgi:hypothetical protein
VEFTFAQVVVVLIALAATCFVIGVLAFSVGWMRATAYASNQRMEALCKPDRQAKKQGDTRENIANRFVNVVSKTDLAKHYEVERSSHHLSIADYVSFVRTKDHACQATVEVNFARPFDHHVRITIPGGYGWHFGSDNCSLQEAVDHLTTGLWNQVN